MFSKSNLKEIPGESKNFLFYFQEIARGNLKECMVYVFLESPEKFLK